MLVGATGFASARCESSAVVPYHIVGLPMMGSAINCCDIRLSIDQLARDMKRWNGESRVVTARVEQGKTLAAASGTRISKHVLKVINLSQHEDL